MWCLALALVAWAARATSDPRIDQHRLRHRLGELTIIVLGEILVKMVLTVGEETLWSVSLVALVPAPWHPVGDLVEPRRDGRPVPVLSQGSRRVRVAAIPLHVEPPRSGGGTAQRLVVGRFPPQADGATALLASPLAVVMGSLAHSSRMPAPVPSAAGAAARGEKPGGSRWL